MDRYLWFTDLHLTSAWFWAKQKMYYSINKEEPAGVFITGDISSGFIKYHVEELAKHINCPIYFVLGNHCSYFGGFKRTEDSMNELCDKYPNLHWLERDKIIELNEHVGLIGTRGWYSLSIGDLKYVKYTFDWFMVPELRKLKSWEERFEYSRNLAKDSANFAEIQLKEALKKYSTIYLLTHFPIAPECTNDQESLFGKYWLPYNVNYPMGEMVKRVMKEHKKSTLLVFSGHVHQSQIAHISSNIISFTGNASYVGQPKNCNRIFI